MASTAPAPDDDAWDLPPPDTDANDPYRTKAYVPQPDAKPASPYTTASTLGVMPANSNAGLLGLWPPPGNTPGPMVAPNVQTSVRPDGTVVPYKPPEDIRKAQGTSLALGTGPPANVTAATLGVQPKPLAPGTPGGEVPAAGGNQGGKLPWQTASPAIQAHESGGRNVPNATGPGGTAESSASGPWQMIDSTWQEGAKLAGFDGSQWAHAEDAPRELQERAAHAEYDRYGMAPWKTSTNPDGTPAAKGGGSFGANFEHYRQDYLRNNPGGYDPSSVNYELERINRDRMAAEQPLLDARMRRQRQEEAEADDEYSELKRQRDLNNPALKPWTQKPPQPDPIGGLASLGSVFAAIASAFSHTPAIAAMNGMAAAIDARNEGNQKQYDEAFKAYQYNAQLALDRNAVQQKAYDAAWARVKENPELGLAELRSVAQIYGDEQTLVTTESGNLEKADEINRARQDAATKWAIELEKLDPDVRFGTTKGSPADAAMNAKIQEFMANGDDRPTATQKAYHWLLDQQAANRVAGTQGGQQLNDIKNDLRKQYPQASEGELDRRANALLADSKRLGTNNPKTMAFLAFKQKHIDEGDSETDATMKAYTDINAFGQGGAATPDMIEFAATVYVETGHMPSLGFGGSATRMAILTKAAEIAKTKGWSPEDVIAIQSGVKADQATLTALSKTRGNVDNFEQTALKEMDLAKTLMVKGGAQGGIPVINRWIQAGRRSIEGDPDVVAFDTAITSFKNEYAKIMSSPGAGNAVTSDSARAEADSVINGSQSREALTKNMETMRIGMQNRIDSINQEIAETTGRLKGAGKPNTPQPVQPAQAPTFHYDKDGNRIQDQPT